MPTASSWAKTYKLCYTFSQSPMDCLTEYDGKVSSLQPCGLLTLGTGMSLSLLSGSPTISLIRCILQNKCTAMPGASQYCDWMSVLCQLSSPPIPSSIFFQHTLSNFIFIFLPDASIEGPWVPLFLPWLGLRDVLFPCYWCWQSRAHFSPMCCRSLRQNVQDVFWLPRIPGGIIIPSLSFPHSAPSALLSPSPPLGLYALLYRVYSLYSMGSHLFCLRSSCQRNYWRKHSTPDTPRCASRQAASGESMPLQHPQTLKVFWVLV